MTSRPHRLALAALALTALTAFACSSSNTPPAGDAATTTDTGGGGDTGVTDVGHDTAPPPDTGSVEDTGPTTTPDAPPPSKCTPASCTGAYQRCCPSSGACYDTRSGSCY